MGTQNKQASTHARRSGGYPVLRTSWGRRAAHVGRSPTLLDFATSVTSDAGGGAALIPRRLSQRVCRSWTQWQEGGVHGVRACDGRELSSAGRRFRRTDAVEPAAVLRVARRYDEWPCEDTRVPCARGANEGWHKHGQLEAVGLTIERRRGRFGPRACRGRERRPLGAYIA